MAAGGFYEKDMGFDAFIARTKAMSGENAVFVGYLRSSGTYKNKDEKKELRRQASNQKKTSGWISSELQNMVKEAESPITLAQLAATHEFGSGDGHVPERSFMRSAIAGGKDAITKMAKSLAAEVVDGKKTEIAALGVLGEFLKTLFRKKIDSNIPPPNAPSTVARKHSSHTLIDTGQLRGALDWEIQKGKKP